VGVAVDFELEERFYSNIFEIDFKRKNARDARDASI